MLPDRSGRVASCVRAAVLLTALASAPLAQAFGLPEVEARAREMAGRPWVKPAFVPPRELRELTYDQHRDVRFDATQSVWRRERLPFELQFFHLGGYFDQPVQVSEIVNGKPVPIGFDPTLFDYGRSGLVRSHLKDLGFAGFRVHYALNTPKYKDELAVFLGASYFRALGKGQRYGSSARGLALDTAEPGGEEFPRFEQFWIERPARDARELTLYALLNSKRVVGAYRFVLRPGAETVTEVTARLYFRESNVKVGLAPLTAMYLFGENQRATVDDFRPEVHDADGLSIQTAQGEWIWRPLVNPRKLLVTSYELTDPRGFGLMQRDRAFSSYEDLEAHYELRPSMWVEPIGRWGAGRVELVQIPTPDETHDNIVAYWVPKAPPKPGQPLSVAYRLLWQGPQDRRPPALVAQTRRGHGWARTGDDLLQFHIDFAGPALARLSDQPPLEADFTVGGNGQRTGLVLQRNVATGGWRLSAQVKRLDKDKPVELRAVLRQGGKPVSETWSAIVPPQ